MIDSPAFRPLHSANAIRFGQEKSGHDLRGTLSLRSAGAETAETVRNGSCASRPNRRERGQFSKRSTPLPRSAAVEENASSTYAKRYRCVALVWKTARPRSAGHLSLTLRRHTSHRTGTRTPTPLRPQPLRSALSAKSQSKLWRVLTHRAEATAKGREASPGQDLDISRETGQPTKPLRAVRPHCANQL